MSKVKNFFANLIVGYKNNIKQYTVTNIVIILTTIILTFVDYDVFSKFIGDFMLISIICTINFFTIETYCKKTWQRLVSYIVGIVIAVGFNILINNNESIIVRRILIGYAFIVFLVGFIKIIKNSKLEFSDYLCRIFKNLFNTGIIYLILNIGLTIIMSVFVMLLLDNRDTLDLLIRLQIALLGLFAIPACIIAITNTKAETSKFIETIICFVLLPLTILSTVIIYMYMAKIFILKQIPANAIFRILASLFIVAFPVWTMAYNFKEKSKIILNFCRIMPIAFIPFIGLQIYSISARCIENGITPLRYIGIMFIIFEIVAIFLSIYKNKKYLVHIVTTAVIIIMILTILPIVNIQTISNISQSNRLRKAWEYGKDYEELSEENKRIAKSAYLYIRGQENAEKYIPSYLSKDLLESQFVQNSNLYDGQYNYKNEETKFIKYIIDSDGVVPIAGYSRMQKVSQYFYNINKDELGLIPLNSNWTIDMKEYILELVEKNKISYTEANQYIIDNRLLKIRDDRDFYITEFIIEYTIDKEGNLTKINHWELEGYILIK